MPAQELTRRKRKANKSSRASRANHFELYQAAVQCPEAEIHFFDRVFKKHRRRRALSMKEDFCGTAFLSIEWAKTNPRRTAIGVDLDGPTLAYARSAMLGPEPERVRARVQLVQADVHDVVRPKVDLTCALNFSYCVFKTRDALRRYFTAARKGLNDEGMLVCDLFGGTEAIDVIEEERKLKGFTYVWDQADYNPITNEILCHIHFRFPDGSKMEKAFTYDWRLWSIPEVKECMEEAGFKKVEVYWEPEDEPDNGEILDYRYTEKEENQEGWLVYVVGIK
jgi:SAM-dependent methyltransferase